MATGKRKAQHPGTKSQKRSAGRKAVPRKSAPRLEGEELKRAVRRMQDEPNEEAARRQWKQIEKSIFGVSYDD